MIAEFHPISWLALAVGSIGGILYIMEKIIIKLKRSLSKSMEEKE